MIRFAKNFGGTWAPGYAYGHILPTMRPDIVATSNKATEKGLTTVNSLPGFADAAQTWFANVLLEHVFDRAATNTARAGITNLQMHETHEDCCKRAGTFTSNKLGMSRSWHHAFTWGALSDIVTVVPQNSTCAEDANTALQTARIRFSRNGEITYRTYNDQPTRKTAHCCMKTSEIIFRECVLPPDTDRDVSWISFLIVTPRLTNKEELHW